MFLNYICKIRCRLNNLLDRFSSSIYVFPFVSSYRKFTVLFLKRTVMVATQLGMIYFFASFVTFSHFLIIWYHFYELFVLWNISKSLSNRSFKKKNHMLNNTLITFILYNTYFLWLFMTSLALPHEFLLSNTYFRKTELSVAENSDLLYCEPLLLY